MPKLAAELPVRIPEPVALGSPTQQYPFPWSIRRWLDGTPLDSTEPHDRNRLAEQLGSFLVSLRSASEDGPLAGAHSF